MWPLVKTSDDYFTENKFHRICILWQKDQKKKKKPVIVTALAGPPPEVAVVWVWPAISPALGAIFLLQLTPISN